MQLATVFAQGLRILGVSLPPCNPRLSKKARYRSSSASGTSRTAGAPALRTMPGIGCASNSNKYQTTDLVSDAANQPQALSVFEKNGLQHRLRDQVHQQAEDEPLHGGQQRPRH